MSTAPWTAGGPVARTVVDAGPGARIIDRAQLADQRVFQALKAHILNPEGGVTVIDPASTALAFDGRTVNADTPEGRARVASLQDAWTGELARQRALGDALADQPHMVQTHYNLDH